MMTDDVRRCSRPDCVSSIHWIHCSFDEKDEDRQREGRYTVIGTDLVVLLVSHKILHLTGFKLVTTVQTVYHVMRERRRSALLAVVVHTSGKATDKSMTCDILL